VVTLPIVDPPSTRSSYTGCAVRIAASVGSASRPVTLPSHSSGAPESSPAMSFFCRSSGLCDHACTVGTPPSPTVASVCTRRSLPLPCTGASTTWIGHALGIILRITSCTRSPRAAARSASVAKAKSPSHSPSSRSTAACVEGLDRLSGAPSYQSRAPAWYPGVPTSSPSALNTGEHTIPSSTGRRR